MERRIKSHMLDVVEAPVTTACRPSVSAVTTGTPVPVLIEAIFDYIESNNQNPHIFVWTASVDRIMTKIAKCKEASDAPR